MANQEEIGAMKKLFAGLVAGDGLYASVSNGGESVMVQISVLRRDGPLLVLSTPSKDRWEVHPSKWGPFQWDDEESSIMDNEGDVPAWYSTDIQYEKGAAAEATARYALVPRKEDAKVSIISGKELQNFLKGPVSDIVSGIAVNGEAGSSDTQISLALDSLGIRYDSLQLTGLVTLYELLADQQVKSVLEKGIVVAISKSDELNRDNDSATASPGKGKCTMAM